ncbi:FAD-dependent oxidoreductase [Nocardia sp. NPDC050413]|uniref:FAD-dependent oxidoreductase n=1 Tax=Nocardia sp. NPDC050413 TaxID=3155784 RepID=UPI0033C763F5
MKHRIVVLGAGYAGANAAGRLAKRLHPADVDITLVNADPEFVERVRMHQLAAGQDLRSRPLTEVFAGTGVRVRLGRVTAVDVDHKTVTVDDGNDIAYDTMVYALGSMAASGAPGVAEHAYDIAGKLPRSGHVRGWRAWAPVRPCWSSVVASPASKRPPRSPRPDRISASCSSRAVAWATG